jgi:hypothetical protein
MIPAPILPLIAPVFLLGAALEVWLVLRLRAAWHRKSASEQALLLSIVHFSRPGPIRLTSIERRMQE